MPVPWGRGGEHNILPMVPGNPQALRQGSGVSVPGHTQWEKLGPKTSQIYDSCLYWSSTELRGSIL